MSKIDEMIAELCPDGVEYKRLDEVCQRQKGTSITAAKMKEIASDEGDLLVFGGGKTKIWTNFSCLPNANIVEVPSIVVKSRGNIGFEYCDVPFTNKSELWSYSSLDSDINLKFVYYFLVNNQSYFQEMAKVGKLPQISTGVTDAYKIPVPPIEIQQEIVSILDSFTELEARKAQYSFYRDQLLSFGGLDAKRELIPKQFRQVAHPWRAWRLYSRFGNSKEGLC